MESNFNNKCRACLTENDAMLSLFEVYEHDLSLAMILQSCISTAEISENDGLPSRLCDSCILVITQFYNFIVVYEQSDKKLRLLLKKSKKSVRSNSYEFEELNIVNEEPQVFESDISEPISSDSTEQLLQESGSDEIVAVVQVNPEDVITTGSNQDNLQFYEFTNNGCLEEEQEITTIPEYEVHTAETVQEFKKEIIPVEELENVGNVDASNEYLEIHISDSNEPLVKQELSEVKRENCLYEEITKYECTICGEAHLYAISFQQHMRVKHRLSEIKCDEYASRIHIKVHQSVDTKSFMFQDGILNNDILHKCKSCNKQFHLLSQLHQHAKLHDANKKYVCEVCGSRFIRKTYLDDHKEGHSSELKHVCKFCGKAFRRRTVLRAHKRVHTHPNHYVCELCGRAFTNSSTLKTHRLLIHIRERNFQCLICNLTFPLKSTLNKHVLRHQKRENGEKGFDCTQCEMQYRDKSSLKRHIETKHQGRALIISCPDCPKKYTSKANLMKHRRRHHTIPIGDVS